MITKQFIVAHCYTPSSPLATAVAILRKECKKISPTAKVPKAGDHTTILPTFRAPMDEMRQFSMALSIAEKLCGERNSYRNKARTAGFDFFRNPGNDALIIRIEISQEYRALVEDCRRQLSDFSDWVFPLHDNTFNPHACVIEEQDLFWKLNPHMPRLQRQIPIVGFYLPFPKVLIKIKEGKTTHWEEFDPKKKYKRSF